MKTLNQALALMLCAVIALVLAPRASSHSFYRERIPNGAAIIDGSNAVGHFSNTGDGQLSRFGMDFAALGYAWTPELCWLDSDGDGQSNGVELGDPHCEWVATGGSLPRYTTLLSHPGYASSTTNRTILESDRERMVSHLPQTKHSGWLSSSLYCASRRRQ